MKYMTLLFYWYFIKFFFQTETVSVSLCDYLEFCLPHVLPMIRLMFHSSQELLYTINKNKRLFKTFFYTFFQLTFEEILDNGDCLHPSIINAFIKSYNE